MADAPFDRVPIGFRERPVSDDLNRAQSQLDRTIRFALSQLINGRVLDASPLPVSSDRFYGAGFKVFAGNPATMDLAVNVGLGHQHAPADVPANIGSPDLLGVDDLASSKPLVLTTAPVFTVPTAPAGPNTRIDIIEVRYDRVLMDLTARRQLNEFTGAMDPKSFYKTLSYLLDGKTGYASAPADSTDPISYKIGVAANPGVAPATTAGYVKIAEILVGSSVTSIGQNAVIDRRKIAGPGGVVTAGARYRIEWNGGAPIVTMGSVVAPPGVEIAVWPSTSDRGVHSLYVLGGGVTKAAIIGSVGEGAANTINVLRVDEPPNGFVGNVDGTEQTQLAAATPAIGAAIGQPRARATMRPINQTGGTTSITSAELEDLWFNVTAHLAYH